MVTEAGVFVSNAVRGLVNEAPGLTLWRCLNNRIEEFINVRDRLDSGLIAEENAMEELRILVEVARTST